MTVVVWREGRYQELALKVPQRWSGANFGNYKPSQPTTASPQQ